jgi:hypothetical protein
MAIQVIIWGRSCPTRSANALISSASLRSPVWGAPRADPPVLRSPKHQCRRSCGGGAWESLAPGPLELRPQWPCPDRASGRLPRSGIVSKSQASIVCSGIRAVERGQHQTAKDPRARRPFAVAGFHRSRVACFWTLGIEQAFVPPAFGRKLFLTGSSPLKRRTIFSMRVRGASVAFKVHSLPPEF